MNTARVIRLVFKMVSVGLIAGKRKWRIWLDVSMAISGMMPTNIGSLMQKKIEKKPTRYGRMPRNWLCISLAGCLFGIIFVILPHVFWYRTFMGLGAIVTVIMLWGLCYLASWSLLEKLNDRTDK